MEINDSVHTRKKKVLTEWLSQYVNKPFRTFSVIKKMSLLYRVCKSVTTEAYHLVNDAKVSNVPTLVKKHYVTRKHSSRMRTTHVC